MLPYPALLAVHLLAVMLFVGGFFLAGLILRRGGAPARNDELARLRRLNAFATTPALALVWVAGAAMALEAGWFAARWLQVKLACVLLLTLLHALQSRRLHRGEPGGRWTLPAAAGAVLLIVYLVGAKPG